MAADVQTLGQVFTPDWVVQRMLSLVQRQGRILEPSCGDGAFLAQLPKDRRVGVEYDVRVAPHEAHVLDFFAYPIAETFDTIIGNPPFVRFQDIHPDTKALLPSGFDRRTNLYVFFIWKCLDHLAPNGELIFVTPRDFLQATHARRLNARLMAEGTLTHVQDLGDLPVFKGYAPNCLIWRFERGNMAHHTDDGRTLLETDGQILFVDPTAALIPLHALCTVRVGAVSGMDRVFAHPDGQPFVHAKTLDTGQTRRMLYPGPTPDPRLLPHQAALLARQGGVFTATTWWRWIRPVPRTGLGAPRVYVPAKTRRARPFFTHPVEYFEGSVLALFPHAAVDPNALAAALNTVDWAGQGFQTGGRLLFGQRTLSGAMLPHAPFAAFLPHP